MSREGASTRPTSVALAQPPACELSDWLTDCLAVPWCCLWRAGDEELMEKLVPHIARLVRVDPSFSARPDSVPYRVLPALKALLPASS